MIALIVFVIFTYFSLLWGTSEEVLNKTAEDAIERFKYFPMLIIGVYLSNFTKEEIQRFLLLLAISPFGYMFLYYLNAFGLINIYSDHYMGYQELIGKEGIIFTKHLMWDFKVNVYIIFSLIYFYIKFLGKIKEKNYNKSFIYILLVVFIFISLFVDSVTDSRLMDMVAVAIIVFVTYQFITNKYKLPILIIISILVSSIVYNVQKDSFDEGFNELKDSFVERNYHGSWGFRVGMLNVGYEILEDSPYVGIGINSTKEAVDMIRKEQPELLKFHHNIHSFHNEHLLFLTQVGLLGYIVFLVFIFYFFSLKIQNKNMSILKNSIILMYLMLMVADYFISNKSLGNTFAAFIALFTLYSVIEKDEKKV